MVDLLRDMRLAWRSLWRRPTFTAVAILTLLLGIGANSAIFTVVNSVLLRPLPYKDPERLVRLWQTRPQDGLTKAPTSPLNFEDWKSQNKVFEDLAAFAPAEFNLTGSGEPERLQALRISANLFELLGVFPAYGRAPLPSEDDPGAERVVVLSYSLWQRRFGGDRGVIDRSITLNGNSYRVIGVMPPGFKFLNDSVLWVPLVYSGEETLHRLILFVGVLGRLKPGVSLQRAQANMETINRAIDRDLPKAYAGWGIQLVPLREEIVGDIRLTLSVLSGAVGFVLLVACANVANLLLARAIERRREIAVRTALGASRRRLVREILAESLLLAILGGALGLGLAALATLWLVRLEPGAIPRFEEIRIDGGVAGFTFAISLVTGLLFGLVPAIQIARSDVQASLKQGDAQASGSGSGRLTRNMLVVAELALALVLLIGAGLMIRSFELLQRVDPGFTPRNALITRVSLTSTQYPDPHQQVAFFQRLLERLEKWPGVVAAGAATTLPLQGQEMKQNLLIEGRVETGDRIPQASVDAVTPDYFRAMGIPILSGRAFVPADRADAPPVVIIDEAMARLWFPGVDPLGRRLQVRGVDHNFREIVGLAKEVKRSGLDVDASPQVYVPMLQFPAAAMGLVVRTKTQPLALAATIRDLVWEIDPGQPIEEVSTLERLLDRSFSQQRFNALLMSILSAVALALALVGIYGVIGYWVAQRQREIGVRMALGARKDQVLRLVLRQSMTLIGTGLIVGLAAAFALTRWMSSILYGISSTDATTYLGVSLLMALVALAASYVPARRATRVDPLVVLRIE